MITMKEFINSGLSEIFIADVSNYYVWDKRIQSALEDVFDWLIAVRRTGKKIRIERIENRITVNGKTFLEFTVKNCKTVKKQNIRLIQEQIRNTIELEAVRREYIKVKKEKTIMKIDDRLAFEIRRKAGKGAVKAYEWTQDGWKEDESSEYSPADFFIGIGFSEYFGDFVGQYWKPWVWRMGVFDFEGKNEMLNEYIIAGI